MIHSGSQQPLQLETIDLNEKASYNFCRVQYDRYQNGYH